MPSESKTAWVISLCSQKGGVGKSTIARALATFLRSLGAVVKMVDFDPQQSSIVEWNAARRDKDQASGFDVTSAIDSDQVREMLSGAAFIIIDAPGRASEATLKLAKLSHLIVQPTGGSRDDLVPGEHVFQELVKQGIPSERLAFALSRIDSDAEEKGTRLYLESQGYTVLDGCLHNRSGYKVAQNNGRSALETNFDSLNDKAAELVGAIVKRLFAIHEPATQVHTGAGTESKRLRASRKENAA